MIERIRSAIGRYLARLGAELVGPGLPSARADDGSGGDWGLISGGDGPADRDWTAIREDLQDALEAWRLNAWVRQIVRLVSAYVVGDGMKVSSTHHWVFGFVERFWSHRQNKIDTRLVAWCDELTRSGELFVVLFPNEVDGMQYVRAIPASQIQRVETDSEDYEKETGYVEIVPGQVEPRPWKSKHTAKPNEPCVLHYAVNRPVGATRGEGDLVPLLPWARRYADWLKGRVQFEKIRNELAAAEIIIDDDSQVEKKREQYRVNPPTRGSIFVHGRGEELKFPSANVRGYDVAPDGKALRLAMATAGDIPLHFFSEGESANRATAVEMGDPTHRFFRQRQRDFGGFLVDLVEQAYRRRCALLGLRLPANENLQLVAETPDISRADNQALATAAKAIVETFGMMSDRGWITDEIAVRLSFKFAGELLSEDDISLILEGGENERNSNGRNGQEEELERHHRGGFGVEGWERIGAGGEWDSWGDDLPGSPSTGGNGSY
jgi:hypothetical protein